jgi:muramidase (phage lysozyme)
MSKSDFISPNARRWLNLISYAEGTWGGRGPRYDITFGYTPITNLSRHPNRVVRSGRYASAAAGAYQFMPATWQRAAAAAKVRDFGPQSQDLAALQLMRWRGVDPDKSAITPENIARLSGEWAAFPTMKNASAYNQPSKSFQQLLKFAQSQGAKPVSYDPTARYVSGDSTGNQTEDALAQTILSGYIGALLSQSQGDRSLDRSTMPDVPHSKYEETDELLEDKLFDTYAQTENLKQQSRQDIEQQILKQSESQMNLAKERMNQLIANAQQSFKPASAII